MKLKSLLIILSLMFSSCSHLNWFDYSGQASRLPASNVEEISYYLSIDKFKYYLNEYSVAQEGKIPEPIVKYLRELDIVDIFNRNLDATALKDANNYDRLIWQIVKEEGLHAGATEKQLQWGYNFFKNKLNEAFNLAPSKLNIALSIPTESTNVDAGTKLIPIDLLPEDMTLDSGHYISNRTTRAVFWDANENNRPIEFHLGDSREFLKELKEKNGELLYEVKPFAKNYNKIYIIQYPGESTYRYAITNIGGQDRLDHLTHQISLSNLSGKQLKSKILVKGDIQKFHAAKAEEHVLQLKLLPQADRVIIGQKESIDGKFNLFWKIKALQNLYDDNPSLYESRLSKMLPKDRQKLQSMMSGAVNHETIFKDKKPIEDAYALVLKDLEKKPSLIPEKFKLYNYDNFTIEMCDYVFEGNNGKPVRWRVVSNVWGDEIIPIAEAFKKTGHTAVTYMGTAGAFSGKGYKVGDLVAPTIVYDGDKKLTMHGTPMKIDGARYGGSVEHVGSPFEESHAWLKKAQARSEFVEVETSYLRRIFNAPTDKLEIFLLISDILGSDTETLAHATSSKRKNAQNKLLAQLFERDSKKIPSPSKAAPTSLIEKNKMLVFKVLEKKTPAFRYYAFSHLKSETNLTESAINDFVAKKAAFTDSYLLDRLVKISEVIHQVKLRHPKMKDLDIAFSKSLALGTWNPKEEKLSVTIKASNAQDQKLLEQTLAQFKSHTDAMKTYAVIDVKMAIDSADMIWLRIPEKTDPDLLVKLYTLSGFKNAGLYKNVTYNGNLTLDFLPTSKVENALAPFYQGKAVSVPAATGGTGTCLEAMSALLKIL